MVDLTETFYGRFDRKILWSITQKNSMVDLTETFYGRFDRKLRAKNVIQKAVL